MVNHAPMAEGSTTQDQDRRQAAVGRTLQQAERLKIVVVFASAYAALALLFGFVQLGSGDGPGWAIWWLWSCPLAVFIAGLAALGWIVLRRLADLSGGGPWHEPAPPAPPALDHYS
jgi:hypothetical protein